VIVLSVNIAWHAKKTDNLLGIAIVGSAHQIGLAGVVVVGVFWHDLGLGLTSDYTGLDIIPLGMISKRLGAADESFGFIEGSFTPPDSDCKAACEAWFHFWFSRLCLVPGRAECWLYRYYVSWVTSLAGID
jgi:hypothetical protein